VTDNGLSAERLLTQMGGVKGLIYSSLPVVVFVGVSGAFGLLPGIGSALGVGLLLPGHGPALTDPAGTLDYYIAHRAERLDQVRSALAAGAKTPAEIVAMIYTDVDKSVWPAAEWSVRAQLDYLGEP